MDEQRLEVGGKVLEGAEQGAGAAALGVGVPVHAIGAGGSQARDGALRLGAEDEPDLGGSAAAQGVDEAREHPAVAHLERGLGTAEPPAGTGGQEDRHDGPDGHAHAPSVRASTARARAGSSVPRTSERPSEKSMTSSPAAR